MADVKTKKNIFDVGNASLIKFFESRRKYENVVKLVCFTFVGVAVVFNYKHFQCKLRLSQ